MIAAIATGGVVHLLIMFLVILVVILVLAGLIYAVETWIIREPLPNPLRLVIGLIVILVIVIWVLNSMGGT